ncbi:hypothetical protein ACIKTA_05445 [Hansschlegelia beijingensis]
MSDSFTESESLTFTLTHARDIAAKVATDLKRMQRLYDKPSDKAIADYEAEVTEMLRGGYLDSVSYGFKRNGDWIEPTLRYTARDLAGASANNDDPGRIRPGADTSGATFYSYLITNTAWLLLSESERAAVEAKLPFKRGGADEPGVSGYLTNDRTYSSGGKALDRSIVRSF